MDEGYFAREGVSLEAVQLRAAEVLPAMALGDIDVSAQFVSVAPFAAMAQGVPLRIVADKGSPTRDGCPADGVLASAKVAERPRIPESLRGARISFSDTTVAEYVVERFLQAGGLGRDDFEYKYIQTQNSGMALQNGSVDFRLISEPELTNVTSRGQAELWMSVAEMKPDVQWAVVTYGPKLLEDHDAGERFLRAYMRGVRTYNEGKTPSNVASIARHTGLDPAIVRESCWTQIRGDGTLNLQALTDFQEWARSRGYLDRVLPPSEFADMSYLQGLTEASR
jgi:NitT/TauT family transport system substrate-binding protein